MIEPILVAYTKNKESQDNTYLIESAYFVCPTTQETILFTDKTDPNKAVEEQILGFLSQRFEEFSLFEKPKELKCRLIGFNLKDFFESLVNTCSLPEIARPVNPFLDLPSLYVDLFGLVKVRQTEALITFIKKRRPLDISEEVWEGRLKDWQGLHTDLQKEILLTTELAVQFGVVT